LSIEKAEILITPCQTHQMPPFLQDNPHPLPLHGPFPRVPQKYDLRFGTNPNTWLCQPLWLVLWAVSLEEAAMQWGFGCICDTEL